MSLNFCSTCVQSTCYSDIIAASVSRWTFFVRTPDVICWTNFVAMHYLGIVIIAFSHGKQIFVRAAAVKLIYKLISARPKLHAIIQLLLRLPKNCWKTSGNATAAYSAKAVTSNELALYPHTRLFPFNTTLSCVNLHTWSFTAGANAHVAVPFHARSPHT